MRKFIQSQEIYEDPSMKDYLDGLGFDNTRNPLTNGPRLIESEIKVSNFLPRYFSQNQEQLLRIPYRLPGIGIPTSEINVKQQDNSRMVSIFKKFSGPTLNDAFGFMGQMKEPDENTARDLINVARKALIFASGTRSIWEGEDSEMKMKSDSLVAGYKTNDEKGIYDKGYTPLQFKDAVGKEQEDLAKVIPYVDQNQLFDVINFSQMRPIDGSNKQFEYMRVAAKGYQRQLRKIALMPPLQSDRRQLLFNAISRQIRLGEKLPLQKVAWKYTDFKRGRRPYSNRYIYEERERAKSRFSLANVDRVGP